MAVSHSSVTVSTTATSLLGAVQGARAGRSNVTAVARTLVLKAAADLFVGGPGVTSSSYGVKVTSGETLSLDLKPGDAVFAVVASGSVAQPVLHLGV